MRLEMLWLILGMMLVTLLSRFLPMALLTRWSLGPRTRLALSYLPVAILSSIIFPVILPVEDGALVFTPHLLLAAIPTAVFAVWKKNLWGTVLVGMLCYWLLDIVL